MTPYFQQDGVTLYHGDCREVMAGLPDESVHAIVTDPPYGLAFMGKRWDYDVPSVEVWQQCLRVLKPGGHLLAFAGTRTQHRMAVRIEDAGFEIRDMIAWVYGSGFSKGFNLKREPICSCIPTGKPLPYNHEQKTKYDVRPLQNGDLQEAQSDGKKRGEVLFPILSEQGAQEHRATRPESEVGDGKQSSMERREIHRAGKRLCDDSQAEPSASKAERIRSGAHSGCGVNAWQATERKRGSAPQEQEPGGQQAGKPSSVFESPRTLDDGTLCGGGQCPRCGKLKAEFEGWSSQLKPALEPITVARKPLCGTVAENVLTHGCGGLNVDGCRVAMGDEYDPSKVQRQQSNRVTWEGGEASGFKANHEQATYNANGRWPANLIHDGSEEVTGLFPETDGGGTRNGKRSANHDGIGTFHERERDTNKHFDNDSGSAARFFYTAKADKSDRGPGNNHPTVKPVDLMRYLVRLVCPMDGVVLDPFSGSGTTLQAAQAEGCRAIGVEREENYCEIITGRFNQRRLF